MFYEITHKDGSVSQMTLGSIPTTAEAEVAKWPDEMRATVASIRRVDAHRPADPVAIDASMIQAATSDSQLREAVVVLAETIGATRQETAASSADLAGRLSEIEAALAALKGVV
jgi:hypothetical protein